MKHIRIETAANGFVVNEDSPRQECYRSWNPYVFESFAALTKWLRKNLDDPHKPVAPPVAKK